MITIFEALYILAIDDEKGDIVEPAESALESLVARAVIAELALQKRIALVDHRIVVDDQTPTEHPILDKFLFDLLDSARARKLRYWANTLTYKTVMGEIGHQLVETGMLTRKKKHLHLAMPEGSSSGGNFSVQYTLKNRLREIVLAGGEPEISEKILLAFLYHGELLKLIFTQGERKLAPKRVKKLILNSEGESGLGEPWDEIVSAAY